MPTPSNPETFLAMSFEDGANQTFNVGDPVLVSACDDACEWGCTTCGHHKAVVADGSPPGALSQSVGLGTSRPLEAPAHAGLLHRVVERERDAAEVEGGEADSWRSGEAQAPPPAATRHKKVAVPAHQAVAGGELEAVIEAELLWR